MESAPTRILIVDDHELLRDGLRTLLGSDPELNVCGEAVNAMDGRTKIRELQPEVVVVDLTLHDGHGLDLIKWLKKYGPPAEAIVLTMHDENIYGERALRAGASGYVKKDDPARTILTAIHEVRKGKLFFSEELTRRMMNRSKAGQPPATSAPTDVLSDRELEVFRLIGQGKTSRQISERLRLASSTVETYRERLKTKLKLANSAELAQHATLWVAEHP
jgi:DNA-binding NarL/FixJ family response regulator